MYQNKWLLAALMCISSSLQSKVEIWQANGPLSAMVLTDEQLDEAASLAMFITKFDKELSVKIKQYPVGEMRNKAIARIEAKFKKYLATRTEALKIFHENYKVRTIIVKPCVYSEAIYIKV